jgi:DNA polymerase I-like protein with 3'-5' exonuclease and polymerase domains
MPSAKEKVWKLDMWLPRTVAKAESYAADHPWWTVLAEYSTSDSEATMLLFKAQWDILQERGLWNIYLERLKVLPVAYKMEQQGITVSQKRLDKIQAEYRQESLKAGKVCTTIAKKMTGVDLVLPKSGNNNMLREFLFTNEKGLRLISPVVSEKTGAPSLDKTAMATLIEQAAVDSPQRKFLEALRDKRKRDTAINYMDSYKRFWLPHARAGWHILHPSLNPTGTDTLRWSSSNPNEQNISKQEGFNLRYCFGPAPGREWWSLDAKNIELRLPAYEAREQEMIDLFEHPDDPPFYGSNHLLVFSVLYPKLWKEHGADVKKKFASTNYQWVKNGNFAVQYGAMESSGTADRAYHLVGAQRTVQSRFNKIAKLNERMIKMANEKGYVETIPDKTVDPDRGYPLLCTRSTWGKILPTVPLNYHIQGTACWWMMKAMVRCQAYLDTLNAKRQKPTYHLVMQIHDEMVFDFPKVEKLGNLPKIRKIKRLMEESGKDLGIPTPVSCEYHEHNWSEGVSV